MEILKVQQTDCGGRCGSDDFWVSKMHASAASSGARRAVAQRSRDRDKPAHFKWLVERIRERMEDLGQGTLPDGVFVHYASSHILLLSVTALEQVGEGLISSTLAATAGAPNCSGVLGSAVTLLATRQVSYKTKTRQDSRQEEPESKTRPPRKKLFLPVLLSDLNSTSPPRGHSSSDSDTGLPGGAAAMQWHALWPSAACAWLCVRRAAQTRPIRGAVTARQLRRVGEPSLAPRSIGVVVVVVVVVLHEVHLVP